jgi:predicted alpha/beta hydrolase family esterase
MTHELSEYLSVPRKYEFVTVPGIRNSGPEHWQTWIEEIVGEFRRIKLGDWDTPDLGHWTAAIGECLSNSTRPAILVAHSFGCLAAAQFALDYPEQVAGVLLVAPADPSRFSGVTAPRKAELSCPGILVASRNDPWMEIDVARDWARAWGLEFWDEGRAGHINAASGHGRWIAGLNAFSRIYFRAGVNKKRGGYVSHPPASPLQQVNINQAR